MLFWKKRGNAVHILNQNYIPNRNFFYWHLERVTIARDKMMTL